MTADRCPACGSPEPRRHELDPATGLPCVAGWHAPRPPEVRRELRVPVPWCPTCHQGEAWVVAGRFTDPVTTSFPGLPGITQTSPARLVGYVLDCGHVVDAAGTELVIEPTEGPRPYVYWSPMT